MRGTLTAMSRPGWRGAVAILSATALVAVGGGCGGGEDQGGDPVITVAAKDTGEEVVLAEIYAQALEAARFKVRRNYRLSPGLPPFEQKGVRLSGYPEHLNIALKDILGVKRDVPGDPREAYKIAKEGLEEKGLTAFPPTAFSRSKAVGMLRRTAEEHGLKTLSDLSEQSGQLSLEAKDFCTVLPDCLPGLERFYGISFGSFTAVDPKLRYKVLENGEADAVIVLTTDGQLAGKHSKFVALEDDEHRFPAGHVVWLTTKDLADELGPRYEKAVVGAQKGLTLKTMQEFDATANLEKRPPAEIAAEYLKSIGYGGSEKP